VTGPRTDTDALGRQRQAVTALAGLLDRARAEGLPVMDWEVPPSLSLVARPRHDDDPGVVRADWRRWCDALGAPGREATVGAVTFLSGLAEVPVPGDRRLLVAVVTEVPAAGAGDGGAGR